MSNYFDAAGAALAASEADAAAFFAFLWCFLAGLAEASPEAIADAEAAGAEAIGAEAEAEAEGAAAKAEAANREATRAAMILDMLNSFKG
ncbi:MAG: hypothetical protein V4582_07485 [Pseudomonadota bacterium]